MEKPRNMSKPQQIIETKAFEKEAPSQERQRNATEPLAKSFERTGDSLPAQRTRTAPRTTIRAVTPEATENRQDGNYGIVGPIHSSPRSIPGGEKPRDRRQGQVFQDSYGNSEPREGRHGPPVSFNSSFNSRPRTRTLEEPSQRSSPATSSGALKSRHRIGSVHSTASSSFHDVQSQTVPDQISPGYATMNRRPSPQLQKSNSVKGGRRLLKKSSRPTSPTNMEIPSVDSLPFPVETEDANKILMLMKTLCGRMRGQVQYQITREGPWHSGICYVNDSASSLMSEGEDNGPFHTTIIPDLRGCRVKPATSEERQMKCLELSNRTQGIDITLIPMAATDYDRWLAALLCWQQIRTGTLPGSPPRSSTSSSERRQGSQRRASSLKSNGSSKPGNIIKVAKLLLWDKGVPSSPAAIVRRTSTRDLRSSPRSSWRKVSCILQDNGEFKLLTENDITLLSVIQLSQLSRCSIQRLARSCLDEEYCIAIFPQYTPNSTQLSIFRPVYIALESRLTHEVWFCLLRAFTIPEIYGPQPSLTGSDYGALEMGVQQPATDDMFRIEKSISLRVIEAKIRRPPIKTETIQPGRPVKAELDPSVGDYFAEVVLDGELRARTVTKKETKSPFWREECEFQDLPAHVPSLTIVLKQLEHPVMTSHGFLSSSNVSIPPGQLTEVVCGTVEVSIEKLEKGQDNEAWWPILDGQQGQIGEMMLRVRHDELVVLLHRDYLPISELLHNFGSGLTIQIAQVIPTNLKALSEILINIFQVSGSAGDWLKSLVEDEIDGLARDPPVRRLRWSRRIGSNESFASTSDREATVRDMDKSLKQEANLLFRGNSLLTQSLDFHMRRVGKEYLEEVLSEKVVEINTLNPDCEVDPSRLPTGQDITKNWSLLVAFTTEVWESISGSATRCPPDLRHIMKYIRAVAEDRYGDFLKTTAYTSVSGFLFLRFFCPALLNPKLFGLLRDHPKPKAQRTLTLIAKSLQVLANLQTFGEKEHWMEPMNRFLAGHKQSLKDFIDVISSIPAERSTALPASYSTPMTILQRLPPTSKEGFPSLPYLIDHARSFSALVKLWLDTTGKYMAPQGLEGELLEFHKLCIALKRRTDDCFQKAEQADQKADQLSLKWDDIVEGLDGTTIHTGDSTPRHNSDAGQPSPRWTDYPVSTTTSRAAPGSSGSEIGTSGKEKKHFWEGSFGKDGRAHNPYDINDTSQASPPSRGQSRNGKQTRSFLGGLKRKVKGEKEAAANTSNPNTLDTSVKNVGAGGPKSPRNGGSGNVMI